MTLTDAEIDLNETKKIDNIRNKIIKKHTGHSLDFIKKKHKRDWYLNAKQAKKLNFVDKILKKGGVK